MSALEAYASTTENIYAVPTASREAYVSVHENVYITPTAAVNLSAYASVVEHIYTSPTASRSAYVSVTENIISTANPYRLFAVDPATGLYVQAPWYIWNGTAWVQAV